MGLLTNLLQLFGAASKPSARRPEPGEAAPVPEPPPPTPASASTTDPQGGRTPWNGRLVRLYLISEKRKAYWEARERIPGTCIVHWGALGSKGRTKFVRSASGKPARGVIESEIDRLTAEGYAPVDPESFATLMIEYAIEGMGTEEDLEKRHSLEDRMIELLESTCLGSCDGGSIGSGTMEVCNFVVDFAAAKKAIRADLAGTEYADYSRIYEEDPE